MGTWKADINRGIQQLSKHDPEKALKYFNRALAVCPVSSGAELSRLLFYLGVAFKKLGYSNSAVRSWTASQRLKKRKNIKKLLKRFSNGYGMARQDTEELDDWNAFYSIQLMHYLVGFNKRTLTDRIERSMLKDIIFAYWTKLKSAGILNDKIPSEKSEIFKETKIDFPLFFHARLPSIIQGNFLQGGKLKAGDRCPCGSGLPFCACCGRTPGEDELSIGLF